MNGFLVFASVLLAAWATSLGAESVIWSHIKSAEDLGASHQLTAGWDGNHGDGRKLKLTPGRLKGHSWAVILPPAEGWDLANRGAVEAKIYNPGAFPAKVMLWVVGECGWDAVGDIATLAPGATRRFSCSLRETFPDGTPKIDPGRVKQVQIILFDKSAGVEVSGLVATGLVPNWKRPAARLDVPVLGDGAPAAGKRVRHRLAGDEKSGVYCVVNLPEDWKPGGSYPVIVEFPGNIYFTKDCYSTGLPDQCVIGYGMTRGKGAICLGLPFLDRKAGMPAVNGWGNPDDTADYAVKAVEEICSRFGGDRRNLILTGFSRGALACGYIGLRNDRIAGLWKGIHACQHYDGGGWGGATMDGARARARRFRGRAVFQTDNPREKFQALMDVMNTEVTWADSGLGGHATAMFLDDRPSTQALRQWFADLVKPDSVR